MGKVTVETLGAIGVPSTVLPGDLEGAKAALAAAVEDARARKGAHAIVIKKGTFNAYKLKKDDAPPYQMTREHAIERAVVSLPKRACVVATTGMPSRELFEVREKRKESHRSDLLTVGGMGHASQIALGIALESGDRPVYCLDGDGAVLMHMGALATIASLSPTNFKHVVVNNGAHDSVGGQPTVAFAADLVKVALACGYKHAVSVSDEAAVDAALADLASREGPALVEIRVKKGSRKDLGRPTQTPSDLKNDVMAYLSEE
jgi:phosphonopyruvate decarboxylase